MNLKEWIGSKKTKNALMGVVAILIVVGMLLAASGGDSEKFGALLQMVWPYVLGMLSLLGITNLGQSHVDAKLAENPNKESTTVGDVTVVKSISTK